MKNGLLLLLLFGAPSAIIASKCKDSPTFFVKGDATKTCGWIGQQDNRRQKFCEDFGNSGAKEACPQACRTCCADDTDYKFELNVKRKGEKGCKWLDSEEKKGRYCDEVKNNSLVSNMCAISCGICEEPKFPSPSPSAMPTQTCSDDRNYRAESPNNEIEKSCEWIAGLEGKRKDKFCNRVVVKENCAQTCMECCANDRSFSIKLRSGEEKGCLWVQKDATKRCSMKSSDGALASSKCPISCGLCEVTNPPVSSPTAATTKSPTASPTKSPTASPTKSPTASPTKSPTASPTKSPTASPTKSPTASPTKSPTASPTKVPTAAPIKSPTASPTRRPTVSPVKPPSDALVKSPTASPVKPPTDAPVKSPTASPTKSPTASPTKSPTASPTKSPTVSPVKPPTNAPVKSPTVSPVKPPTDAPVKSPTDAPVKSPTDAPVKSPTDAPVKPPTDAPVKSPTVSPVKPPTDAPVKPPTDAPVKPPTDAPVKPPTDAPVKPPTDAPVTTIVTTPDTCEVVATIAFENSTAAGQFWDDELIVQIYETNSTERCDATSDADFCQHDGNNAAFGDDFYYNDTESITITDPRDNIYELIVLHNSTKDTDESVLGVVPGTLSVTVNGEEVEGEWSLSVDGDEDELTVYMDCDDKCDCNFATTEPEPVECSVIALVDFGTGVAGKFWDDELIVQMIGRNETDRCDAINDADYCEHSGTDGAFAADDYYYDEFESISIPDASGNVFDITLLHNATSGRAKGEPGTLSITVNGASSAETWSHALDAGDDDEITVQMDCNRRCDCSFLSD